MDTKLSRCRRPGLWLPPRLVGSLLQAELPATPSEVAALVPGAQQAGRGGGPLRRLLCLPPSPATSSSLLSLSLFCYLCLSLRVSLSSLYPFLFSISLLFSVSGGAKMSALGT